ncbi:bifunctional (p)ppGpp synthetase/guanosine-3',5'-bis(diphosphate) 3'-pyrophosphohydrolase [Flavobacteriaceae bacterium]|jgi:guanosine-3',5'-bis(diphosphate) 3'-pyrophosphohydrolase|nr:(p)ppGpp synthetase I, SpoT/RelA [Flavobacteria bacterium MS024-3C]MCO4853476.1 bifunctional (p)ppGpp synthetase/guanosine-3',5'-bis(diphosphate) 3'-pyrophosphohydrolase [Flavobacteriaceae bacterium]NQV62941.1 bifunctional (p)ppGpp synthetase/guanosine-3',5'-bis(diphosphate) 3'-pyrophosphohydrolase [Cryomorphaceae bacterium]MDA9273299.1 bifunctional (p)ppGpp synthetase/guanosine-3',5'-bis(diphosphate) 3'-pyrophosphohydrolase [Flavobacteriaceae bacterium]MDA9331422.1 bifunctional (p)ppGpp syn|tara:strand:- start:6941 stop:9148 length:2208 start_codon:yes stop_codon:yes gene_type:complete
MLSEQDIISENKAIAREYKELLRISYQSLSEDDKKLIRLAFDTAVEAHSDQRRKSGEAYIFHPIAVAKIVASEIGLDATSIAAALLHDVVEDTSYTLPDIERLFGPVVAKIVNGLTKIAHLKKDMNISQQAENFRKMLLTLNDDVRVIIIKIADRYHNMLTMDSMPEYKQLKIASETLYIYAPLAHRIGLYNIKTALEDLSLKYTEPEVFNDISDKIEESKEEQQKYIDDFTGSIKNSLAKEKFKYTIKGRMKSIFSIRRKMLKQQVTFDEIYDKFAIRIVYASAPEDEKFLAWKIYSVVTDHFTPNPVRLRDWITSPKTTGYEALHITVMGPKGKWIEVQIRSERMHEIAEKGYAAHFKYKHGAQKEQGIDLWLNRLQEALENDNINAVDFVEEFKLNLYSKEIFVFTPKGELKSLPKGATPLDFAFSIHTQIGSKTRGAKVNGKLVPLNTTLHSGDQVDVITSESAKPTQNWLNYATTARARSKIKTALKEAKKAIAEEGKEILRRKLKSQKINLNEDTVNKLVTFFKLKTSLDLYYRVGSGIIDNVKLKDFAASYNNAFISFFKNKIRRNPIPEDIDKEELSSNLDTLVFGKDEEKLPYKLSPCCNAIAGDEVFGFISINDGIKVHKKNCPNAISLQSNYAYRIIASNWIDSSQEEFVAEIALNGLDNLGLVSNITKVISNQMNVNMRAINFNTDGGTFSGKIKVVVKNSDTLKKLVGNLKHINGIEKVSRL